MFHVSRRQQQGVQLRMSTAKVKFATHLSVTSLFAPSRDGRLVGAYQKHAYNSQWRAVYTVPQLVSAWCLAATVSPAGLGAVSPLPTPPRGPQASQGKTGQSKRDGRVSLHLFGGIDGSRFTPGVLLSPLPLWPFPSPPSLTLAEGHLCAAHSVDRVVIL